LSCGAAFRASGADPGVRACSLEARSPGAHPPAVRAHRAKYTCAFIPSASWLSAKRA